MLRGALNASSTMGWIKNSVESFIPCSCAVGVRGEGRIEDLFRDEVPSIAGAVVKRQVEFAAGRAAARDALQGVGLRRVSIPSSKDRVPLWPDGYVGSISHSAGAAVAVVARKSDIVTLGIDLELSSSVVEDIWPEVLSSRERRWILTQSPDVRNAWATVVFCAKEAFYKAQYMRTGTWLGFSDVDVEFMDDEQSLIVRTLHPMFLGRSAQTTFYGSFAMGPVFTIAFLYIPH